MSFIPIKILPARTHESLEEIRRLFREYHAFLGVDLCFQGFEQELAALPGKYSAPEGTLLLAVADAEPAGCVGLRKLEDGICEMKRLYVRPAYQGQGLGRKLAERIIHDALGLGYKSMRLDTLDRLTHAVRLYQALGFRQRAAYYENPLAGVIYWELDLMRRREADIDGDGDSVMWQGCR